MSSGFTPPNSSNENVSPDTLQLTSSSDAVMDPSTTGLIPGSATRISGFVGDQGSGRSRDSSSDTGTPYGPMRSPRNPMVFNHVQHNQMLSVGPTPAQVIEYGNLIAQQQATQVVAQVQQRAEQVVLQHQSHVEASAREYVSSIEQQASASVAQRRQEIESQAVDFRHAVEQQAHAMHQTSLEQLAIMQRRLEQLEIENQQLRSQVFALNRADNGTGPELIPHNTIGQGGEHRNFMDPHVRAELDVVRGDMQQLIAAVRELSGRGFNHPAPIIASSHVPRNVASGPPPHSAMCGSSQLGSPFVTPSVPQRDPLRRCDDDGDDSDEEAHGSPAGSPPFRGDGIRVGIEEGDVYSHKDLKDLKISKLPENAASFRGWKNALITQFSSIDRTGGTIMRWLQEAFRETSDDHLETMKSDSAGLPRLDAFIAAQVSDATHLKGEFGMEVQSYIERSQLGGICPRGRAMLCLLTRRFRIDKIRGANISQQSLLQLNLEGYSQSQLRTFKERTEYVLNSLPIESLPNDETLFTWLFHRLKPCKMMSRYIDKIRDAPRGSRKRSFAWLWSRFGDLLDELREDENERSIQQALGFSKQPAVGGAPAKAAPKGPKSQGQAKPPPVPISKPKIEGASDVAGVPAHKGGGKGGKGKQDIVSKGPQKPSVTKPPPKKQATNPPVCIFWKDGNCTYGDRCRFSHPKETTPAAPAKSDPKPKAKSSVPASVAILAASILGAQGASTATSSNAHGVSGHAHHAPTGSFQASMQDWPSIGLHKNLADDANLSSTWLQACPLPGQHKNLAAAGLKLSPLESTHVNLSTLHEYTQEPHASAQEQPTIGCHKNLVQKMFDMFQGLFSFFGGLFPRYHQNLDATQDTLQNSYDQCGVHAAKINAAVGALASIAKASSQPGTRTVTLEWLGDTGAGRDLGSVRAFKEQGVSEDILNQVVRETAEPLAFQTGGGPKKGKTTVGCQGAMTGSRDMYMLTDCPILKSIGQLVEVNQLPFVWLPKQKPFLVVDQSGFQAQWQPDSIWEADRVEEFVPIFREEVTLIPGNPAALDEGQKDDEISVASPSLAPSDIFAHSDDEAFRRDHVSVDRENSPPAEPPAIVSDERIASDHGSLPAGPPAVASDERIASDADSEPDDLPALQQLQREVGSNLHQATHFPKNRMCDICCRARMYKRRFSRRKADENKGAIPDPKAFGERLSTDFIVVNRSSSASKASPSTPSAAGGASGESYVHVVRDDYSGALRCFPTNTKGADGLYQNFKAFVGPKVADQPTVLVHSDSAPEITSAIKSLGWFCEPTLANHWPHNAVIEREIRTIQEVTRAVHLGAGFNLYPHLWPLSVQYASVVLTATRGNPSRYELATGHQFEGQLIPLGRLVHYKVVDHEKFEASTRPAVFAGYQIDLAYAFRHVVWVLDYQKTQGQGAGIPSADPSPVC